MHSPTIWASIAAFFLTNIVFGQNSQCDQTFNSFFNCLSQKLSVPQSFQSIEQEFDSGHSTLIEKCFASNNAAAQSRLLSKKQCLLDRSTIETDLLGPDGPMRGCNFCQKIAKVVHDKYFQATPAQRQCLRKSILQAAVEEIQPCMQNKLHDFSFRIPSIPDLDSASDSNIELVKASLKHRIWAKSRLDVCAQLNPDRASNTRSCMAAGFPGMHGKICQTIKSCKDSSSPSCQSRYNELQRIACTCLSEKGQEMSSKIDQLRDAIMTSTSTSECSRRVDAAAGSWKNKLLDSLKECFKGDQQGLSKIPASKLVEIGCLRATQLSESGKKQMAIGFRFLRNFLDVMQDRSTRFCACQ
ncbi:hypothetical protein D918_08193 [Trichuris suis]|nr:hypothetical protein D918_08193 [Trichuris suis]